MLLFPKRSRSEVLGAQQQAISPLVGEEQMQKENMQRIHNHHTAPYGSRFSCLRSRKSDWEKSLQLSRMTFTQFICRWAVQRFALTALVEQKYIKKKKKQQSNY